MLKQNKITGVNIEVFCQKWLDKYIIILYYGGMNPEILETIGLNKTQAKTYMTLVEKGELTPPEIAEFTGESRTNSYMVLDSLAELELIEKIEKGKKLSYRVNNPIAIEKLSEKKRQSVIEAETKVKQAMPTLLSYFYSFTERPGVRLFEGADGLKEIYRDILRTKKTLYLIRGFQNVEVLGKGFIEKFIAQRVKLGIKVIALTPKHTDANTDPDQDKEWLMERTWVDTSLYKEPVEINIYGSKIAIASFGGEVMGVIIDSPQMAKALKELFVLISLGASSHPDGVPASGPTEQKTPLPQGVSEKSL